MSCTDKDKTIEMTLSQNIGRPEASNVARANQLWMQENGESGGKTVCFGSKHVSLIYTNIPVSRKYSCPSVPIYPQQSPCLWKKPENHFFKKGRMPPSHLGIPLVIGSVDGEWREFTIKSMIPFHKTISLKVKNNCRFLSWFLQSRLQLSVNQYYFPLT